MIKQKTFVIAEAGVNHNGNPSLAFELIDIAADCGADAVKFQLFDSEEIATEYAEKANYQLKDNNHSKQFEMLKSLELPKEIYKDLKDYCSIKKIDFLCTAFDKNNINFLVEKIKPKKLKIASGEITNAPLLLAFAKTNYELILSTGMSTINEIKEALGVIAFGLINKDNKNITPSKEKFITAFESDFGKKKLEEKVSLLHCTTEYPAPQKDLNLKAIESMKNFFHLNIGYSDHSEGIDASIVSVILGATIIEKHFTLDKNLVGPDHSASLDANELKNLILKIRLVEGMTNEERNRHLSSIKNVNVIMGDGIKEPKESEVKNIDIARRHLVANKNIQIGEVFNEKNISCKRSKKGLSPILYWDLLGHISKSKYNKDDIIK
tara:strand:+ start:1027 stop:2166 length:1140 start_codon:yes stop_codon:yes gene_type:complete